MAGSVLRFSGEWVDHSLKVFRGMRGFFRRKPSPANGAGASIRKALRPRRWLGAGAVSLLLHAATVPAVLHFVDRLPDGNPSLPDPIEAQLTEEKPPPPPKPEEPPRLIQEPQESAIVEPPTEPEFLEERPLDMPPPEAPPRLAALHVTIPEDALRMAPRPPGVTHSPAPRPLPADPPADPPPAPVADPVAPLVPEEPPESLLVGLPGQAVSLGRDRTFLGGEAESEVRRRIYAQTYYPEAAAELELEGVVVVGFRVDGQGNPLDIEVANRKESHPVLCDEAVAMVRRGAPYPVPTLRRKVALTMAVAYLTTPDSRAERIRLVLPSGNAALDERVRQLAAQDATDDVGDGWQLAIYRIDAEVDVQPGPGMVSPRLVTYAGDVRLKRALVEHLHELLPVPPRSGQLKIPIQFRILDD